MVSEDRKHQRTLLETNDVEDRFRIEVYDRQYSLDKIHDVSVSGTGIQIPNEIAPGTPVKLVYSSQDYTISVTGTTVWCSPITLGLNEEQEKASYRTGIQFEANDRNATLFFLALKKHISSIDEGDTEQLQTGGNL